MAAEVTNVVISERGAPGATGGLVTYSVNKTFRYQILEKKYGGQEDGVREEQC